MLGRTFKEDVPVVVHFVLVVLGRVKGLKMKSRSVTGGSSSVQRETDSLRQSLEATRAC